jgi:hypothetical protein
MVDRPIAGSQQYSVPVLKAERLADAYWGKLAATRCAAPGAIRRGVRSWCCISGGTDVNGEMSGVNEARLGGWLAEALAAKPK